MRLRINEETLSDKLGKMEGKLLEQERFNMKKSILKSGTSDMRKTFEKTVKF